MPPKITDLVKYFEEQQQQESSSRRDGSRVSQVRSPSTSPVIARPLQDRRVSAPTVRVTSTTAGSSPVLPRSSSASVLSNHATINSPLCAPKPALLQQPSLGKPAEPRVFQANITNIKSADAAKAVLDAIHTQRTTVETDKAKPGQLASAPPAIRDRFRQPARPAGAGIGLPKIAEESRGEDAEVSTTRPKTSIASPTMVAEEIDGHGTTGQRSVAAQTQLPKDVPPSNSRLIRPAAMGDYHPTVRSPDSARTLVALAEEKPRIVSVELSKTAADASMSVLQSTVWSSRPTLPNSQSNGKLSTYTVDVPAHDVFLPDAKPLDLPLLDDYIDNLPRIRFSDPEEVMCGAEKQGWTEWLAGVPLKEGWFARFRRKLTFSKYQPTAVRDNDEDAKRKPSIQAAKRALIFPPMHRMPPNLTVTDLKHNQTSKAPPLTLNTLLSIAINAVLGAQGSPFAVSLMRVEVFRDLIQLLGTGVDFALPSGSKIMPTVEALKESGASKPKVIVLAMIPSILGLDFVSAFGKAILWLWLFSLICFIACWEFKGMAGGWRCKRNRSYIEERGEGLDSEEAYIRKQQGWPTRIRKSRAYRTCVVFLITSLYLPLSKISIGALAWTSDYWPVDNYYASTDHPTPNALGSSATFRDPLDFCYTTTMRKEGFNWAVPILIVAVVTVCVVTIWFPIRLWLVVRNEVPRVDPYTEMGEKRKDKKAEYERLLDRDRSPFSFVYNEYRAEWAGFKSAYMALKLINVLCITLLTKDNCLFRGRSRDTLNVIRQSTLLGFMFSWMLLQIWARPFIDQLSNNSDWCSRSSYVIIAILGLAAALKLPGQAAYNGWLLVTITVLSFCFNGYFAAVGTGIAQRLIKVWQKRLDFSIDIFSPFLDMPKHIARRIQQETISTLLLAEPEYRLKDKEPLVFSTVAMSDGKEDCPPYLLAFQGTHGERHIENLKILREVGLQRYVFAVEQLRYAARQDLQDRIMRDYTGPDCFWRSPETTRPSSLASYFGRASVVPFPFTLVFRFDLANTTVSLTEEADLQAYFNQNNAPEVKAARRVRLALRALDGKRCFAPFREERSLGRFRQRKSHLSVHADVQYTFCTLAIERNTCFSWRGYNYNSGFKVSLRYGDGRLQRADGSLEDNIARICDGTHIGLGADLALSPTLATFFKNNKDLLDQNVPLVRAKLQAHRDFFAHDAAWKRYVLSYRSLIDVYGNDQLDSKKLEESLEQEEDERTRLLVHNHRGAIAFLRERMEATNRDVVTQHWYILWDDIWRRNNNSIAQMSKHEEDFSPAYRTSICYTPMKRADLQEFLDQRGLWPKPRKKGFFNDGVLNRIYFYLDEILFEGTRGGIPLKVGRHRHSVDFHELEHLKPFDADDSFGRHTVVTFDSGQGTDHDETVIRNRPRFQFEDIYNRRPASTSFATLRTLRSVKDRAGEGVRAWLGLSPYERTAPPPGIYFSLRDVEGTYRAPRGL